MIRHLTYANVMSSIAVFAVLTTGGAYAAVTLKANSVTSRHIKNGQVTLADLHPTVKKRLGTATGGTGGGTTAPGGWMDVGLIGAGQSLATCTGSDCATDSGYTHTLEQSYGGAKSVKHRMTGTITNTSNDVVYLLIRVDGSASYPVAPSESTKRVVCDVSLAPGQTLNVANACPSGSSAAPAAASRYLRFSTTFKTANRGVSSALKVEWSAAS